MVLLLAIFVLNLQSGFAANIVAETQTASVAISRNADADANKKDAAQSKDSRLVRKASESEHDEAPLLPQENREATEAFAPPAKIDDSFFGNFSPRFPAFIEKYPYFYAASFVIAGFAFMGFVCAYVHYEDAKDEERRAIYREIRREAALSGGMPSSFAAFGTPTLSNAALQAAAEAAAASLARAPPLSIPAPVEERVAPVAKTRAGRHMEKEPGIIGFSGMSGLLASDKKFGMGSGSQETTSASGSSSPRSLVSSQATGGSKSKAAGIRHGTVLVARMPEIIFANPLSWQEIGELAVGQQVHAAGPPEIHENYAMVPIKPRGAVDLKALEVLRDY